VIFNEPGRFIGLPCDTGATIKVKTAVDAGFVLETCQSRTTSEAAAKPVQLFIEYDFSSINMELKCKLIFFFSVALRSLVL
jgi:hypothetical protein